MEACLNSLPTSLFKRSLARERAVVWAYAAHTPEFLRDLDTTSASLSNKVLFFSIYHHLSYHLFMFFSIRETGFRFHSFDSVLIPIPMPLGYAFIPLRFH